MPLQRLYANTDTYWKTVGFVGEKSKYTSAFRKSGLDPDNIGDDVTQELINSGINFLKLANFSSDISMLDKANFVTPIGIVRAMLT